MDTGSHKNKSRNSSQQIAGLDTAHKNSRDALEQAEKEIGGPQEQLSVYRGIIENVDSAIFSIDRQYRYTSFNSAHSQIMKTIYNADIEIGHSMFDYMTVLEDREKAKPNIDRALAGEYVKDEAYSGKERRTRLFFEISHSPIKADGEIIGVAVIARDITERKRAEKKLEKFEWLLKPRVFSKETFAPLYGDVTKYNTERTILTALGAEAIKNIVNDFMGLLETSSAVYERNGDYAAGIFSSGWCQFLDNASFRLCDTADVMQALNCGKWRCHESCWTEASRKAIENGIPTDIECAGGIHLYAVPIRAGKEIIGAINFGYGDTPKDPDKLAEIAGKYQVDIKELTRIANEYETRPQFIIDLAKYRLGAAADFIGLLVESKQTEEALIQLSQRSESILNSVAEGIFGTDTDGNISFVNPSAAKMLRYEAQEMIGKNSHQLFHHKKADGSPYPFEECPLQQSIEKGEVFRGHDEVFWCKDGQGFYVEHVNSPLVDDGKIVGSVVVFQDITERKRTEETLRINEAKLLRAQLIGKLGYWSWDVSTNELDWSDQVFRMYGLDPARDTPSLDIVMKTVAPEYAEAFSRALQEAVENDAPFDGDYCIIVPDGSRKYTHTSGEIIRDEQGKPLKMFGIIQDISERKRAEELVKKQLAEITSYYDYAPIGLAVLDTDLRFLRINEYLADINGFTVAEHINKTVKEIVPTLAEQGQKIIDEIIRTGKPLREIEITGETAAQQGVTHTWLEGWHPLKDGDEKIIGFTIIVQDISERKQVEQALQNSEAGLREAQHLAMIGSWDWDIATDDISWSDEYYRISGFEIGSPTPNYIEHLKVYTPESAARLDAAVKKTMDDGTLYDLDLEYALPTAKTRWILARGEPKRDSEGKIVGLRGTAQDITERKRYEREKETLREQLAQSQKLESVGRLAGGIAHDFNNSLQVILGNIDMAMMEVAQGSSLREALDTVRKAAEHSAALTQQLLAFARKQAIEPKMLDLNETIAGYMDLLKRSIGENITFSWEPQAESALVRADHNQIYQALTNLCTNARDAIAGTGKIEIVTHNVRLDETDCAGHIDFRPGDYVMLEVSDDGCGMEPAVLENIFEPFFTTKTFGNSSGLGLATVHGIVTQSGGFIDVQSELGKGTCFRIYLPLVEGGEAAAESLPEAKPVEGHGETVLLVEDEAAILKLEVKVLERLGYKVIPTATPEEALQEAREHIKDIDILVTDVIMPQMNGEELAAMLREFKPELKCLYMSGYTDDIVTHNGVLEKGVNFIQKPFSMEEIGLKIQQMINYE